MENEVWDMIIERHINSGGHNGVYAVEIKNKLNIPYSELRVILNKLWKEKRIS